MRAPANAGGNTALRRGTTMHVAHRSSGCRRGRFRFTHPCLTFLPPSAHNRGGSDGIPIEPGRPPQVSTADTGEVHGNQATE